MQTIHTRIDTGWEVAERLPVGRDFFLSEGGEKNWIPATVPGHVHLDLVKAGVIGDPFYRMQERGCQWVDEADWTYRTTFTVTPERLASRGEHGRHFLHFHGLDTICRVYLNGVQIGSAENFFVSHRFDVTETLREGENRLRVEFDSALRAGRERATAYLGDGTSERGRMAYFNFAPRAFVRKPQYMFGWDWGPELVSCGLWQPVVLDTVPVAEILGCDYQYEFTGESSIRLTVRVEYERYADGPPLSLEVRLSAEGGGVGSIPATVALSGEVGSQEVGRQTAVATINELTVKRWNGGGIEEPDIYSLWCRLVSGEECAAYCRTQAGFRTVELVREPDADGKGESFKFRVNGVDTFIKGANWIPDSTFPAVASGVRLHQRLWQVRNAGYNMLRVWGGGYYQTEQFYNICDQLGILVWQDFPFACSMYPDDLPEFTGEVRREAAEAVKRIRNHPCLALWCGGNENLELFQGRWNGDLQATKFFGDTLIHQVLPEVLAEHDPKTPYWPNSPYGDAGEGNAQNEDYGTSHYWNVWHAKTPTSTGDWTHYAESRSRFSSEFGFAGPAGPYAWDSCMAPEDRTVSSPVSEWHDKTRKGHAQFLAYIGRHYPAPQTFDDLLYYGQCNQADALKFGVEHWRRLKGRCWGTLFWQFNDCWPTHSWAVVDSSGDPKAAYYASKRFYAPLLLSLRFDATGEGLANKRVEVHLVNDRTEDVTGNLELCIYSLAGAVLRCETATVTAPANAAAQVHELTFRPADDPDNTVLHAVLRDDSGNVLAENFQLFDEPKNLLLPDPGLKIAVAPRRDPAFAHLTYDGPLQITISAERYAGYVWLCLDGFPTPPAFSDNWFHLAPGQQRTVTVSDLPAGMTPAELRARLRVRHL
jgi:beta-mannosidase